MPTRGERDADQFGKELMALHAKGDERLGEKRDLVQEGLAIRENLRGLLPEWRALGAQMPAGNAGQAYQSMVEIVERLVGEVESLNQGWEKLERMRQELLEQRKLFDSLQLDRIERNQKLERVSGIPRVRELDEIHDPLKNETGSYIDRAIAIDDQQGAAIRSLAPLVPDQISASLIAQVSVLLQRLADEFAHFGPWVTAISNQYSGRVYALDDEYRAVRVRMEEWQPLV